MREVIREKLLKELSGSRIALIEAPGGYGKSSLVNQYLKTLPENTVIRVVPLVWEGVEYPFPLKLVEKLKTHFNNERFVSTYNFLERGGAPVELAAHRFGREITEVEDGLTIVVEDIDALDKNTISFVYHLLLYAPRNVKIILCSRTPMTDSLPDKIREETVTINKTDLKYSVKEVADLFEGGDDKKGSAKISKATDGWPYGTAMIYTALRSGMNIGDIFADSGKPDYAAITRYCGYESHNEDMRDFLLRTSLLPSFDRQIVRTLFGWRGSSLIEELLRDCPFVEEVGRDIYRYQPLYRSLLRNMARRVFGQGEIEGFLAQSGACLLDMGRYEEGFSFLKHSRNWEVLSRAVKDNLIWLESPKSKRFRLILGRELPQDISAEFPYLGNFKVFSHYFAGEYREAVELTNSLLGNQRIDLIIESRLLYYALFHYHRAGEKAKADDINRRVSDLIEAIRTGEADEIAHKYGVLPWLLTVTALYESFYGDPTAGERLLKEAMSELGEADSLLYYIIAANLLRDVSRVSDEKLTHIESIYERVPKEEADLKAFILARLIICYLQIGEVGKAKEYIPDLYRLDQFVSLYQKIQKYQAISAVNLYEGNIEGYIQTIKNGIASLIQAKNVVLENVWVAKLCLAYLAMGDTANAKQALTDHLIPPVPDSPSISMLLYTLTYIIILGFSGDIEGMKEYVTPMRGNEEWQNIIGRQYGSYWLFVEVLYGFLVGDIDLSGGSYRALSANGDLSLTLLPQLIDRALNEIPGLAESLDTDSPVEFAGFEPVYRLRLLGDFELISPQGELTFRSFSYRKSAELVALLAMRPESAMTVEDVIYQLYGELPPEKGRRRLRVILHHTRKTLGEIGAEGLIERSNNSLHINRELNLEVDAVRFEELLSTAEALKAREEKERAYRFLRDAIELYKGDFLPAVYSDWSTRWYHYFGLLYNRAMDWALELSSELGHSEHLIEYAHRISAYENAHRDLQERAEALIS